MNLVLLEAVEFRDPARLVHVALDLADAEVRALEAGIDLAHRDLLVAEDDRVAETRLAQDVAYRVALLGAGDHHQPLFDIDVGGGRAGDLDRLGVVQELVGQFLDRRGHGGREQQGLATARKLGTDFLDVGDEPHVEHPVGLVDHQQIAIVEHDLAATEQVHQPARGGDEDVDALLERFDLVAHLHAADQQRHRKAVVLAILHEILGDLGGELAGRLEDQAARHAGAGAAFGKDVDHRQHEAGGLAGPGLSDTDQVAAHQCAGDDALLDRGGRVIAAVGDSFKQLVGKAEVGKTHVLSGVKRAFANRRVAPPRRLRGKRVIVKVSGGGGGHLIRGEVDPVDLLSRFSRVRLKSQKSQKSQRSWGRAPRRGSNRGIVNFINFGVGGALGRGAGTGAINGLK